jgi:hypothetical protein
MREEQPVEPRDELDVALRHQGDLSPADIDSINTFISYVRGTKPKRLRRGR